MFPPCEGCPIANGACWPRRANVARVCGMAEYDAAIAAWGASGVPGDPIGAPEIKAGLAKPRIDIADLARHRGKSADG